MICGADRGPEDGRDGGTGGMDGTAAAGMREAAAGDGLWNVPRAASPQS